jgi:SAM-dependent methyltransferase
MDDCAKFYDELSSVYANISSDWYKAVQWHAEALDSLIKEHFQGPIGSILDASCGIGTQLIGLAEKGYRISGSDISRKAVKKAERELKKRGLSAPLFVCDFRDLASTLKDEYDLIISCDNAIPHLLSDDDILLAFKNIYAKTRKGVLFSVRDYDNIDKTQTHMQPYGYRIINGVKTYVFQRWIFEGDIYTVSFFFIRENSSKPRSSVTGSVFNTKYYAVSTTKLMDLLGQAGFKDIRCIKDKYFQPVIIGISSRGDADSQSGP